MRRLGMALGASLLTALPLQVSAISIDGVDRETAPSKAPVARVERQADDADATINATRPDLRAPEEILLEMASPLGQFDHSLAMSRDADIAPEFRKLLRQFGLLDDGARVMLADAAGVVSETSPVPVPAAAWLFASALGLLGWLRRRAVR